LSFLACVQEITQAALYRCISLYICQVFESKLIKQNSFNHFKTHQLLKPGFILTGGIQDMSIVTKSIVNADAEARYLSPGELDRIKGFVTSGEKRLRVAQVLTENRERIVKQAGDQLFQKRPDVVSPGGNAYGQEMTATCLRDMDYYLRLITYGIVSGDVTPIEEIGIVGVREMYKSLGTPIDAVAGGISAMKSIAVGMMSGDDASEAGAYFDYVIGAMS
jgi:allophycocyanin alpha subunit